MLTGQAWYKRHFKSVKDVYDHGGSCFSLERSPSYNNYYVDQHRERFELPVKPKK